MRAAVQRVSEARVRIDGQVVGEIAQGLLVLLGVSGQDTAADVSYITSKIRSLRIFCG
jgi:D-tyrosyl-tRNA(Tyr) deacylase